MEAQDPGRHVLPIPDPQHVGVTTYDAKNPDTSFPPITPVRPPAGCAQRPGDHARRRRVRVVVHLRRAGQHTDLRPARRGRPALHPVPHHRAVLADPAGVADRPQPPLRRHGRDHRDRHVGTRLQLRAPEEQVAAGRDPEAQRLLHRPVRQVPRGAGVGDQPDGTVHRLAHRRRRLRALLRLRRRRDQPVGAGDLPRHGADRAGPHPGAGLPLHRGHDRPGDRVDRPAEVADAGQAVLRLLRARRHPRTAPRTQGMGRPLRRPLRRRLGRAARGDRRAAAAGRRHPGRRRADQRGRTRSPHGTTCPTTSSRCSPARWRSTPGSSSTPTTTSAGSSTRWPGWNCSTTP